MPRFLTYFYQSLLFLSLFLLTACSAKTAQLGNPQAPYPPDSPLEVGQIYHLPTGVQVTEVEMLRNIADNRIVYVGETHDNPASHRLQLTVLKAMFDRYPHQVALGMEMFTPTQDEALKLWIEGALTEKDFLKKAGWYKVWKGDYDYYREILAYAREQKIPVIGLNAEKETVRLVVANEPKDLSAEEQEAIPEMDLSDPYQRGLVEGIYGGHVKSKGMLEGFHRAQTLWDETMAESVVRFMKKPGNEDFRMVVIAGGNHIRYGFGIPRRVFRRMPVSYSLIGGREIEIPESKRDKLMDVELPGFPMTPYDYVVFTRYEELEQENIKLGVMMEDETGKVIVKAVVPGSNAANAGIIEGDIILAIDETDVIDNFDLVYAIKQKTAGEPGSIKIKRGGDTLDLSVEFLEQQDLPDTHHPTKE